MKQSLCSRLVRFGRRNMVSKWLAVSLLWLGSIFSRMPDLLAGAAHAARNRLFALRGRVAPILRAGFTELSARLAKLLPLLRAKFSSLRTRLSHFVRNELPMIPGRAWRSVRNGLREMRVRPLRRVAAIGLGLCTAFAMFPMEAFAADAYADYPTVDSTNKVLNGVYYQDFTLNKHTDPYPEGHPELELTGIVTIKGGNPDKGTNVNIPSVVKFKGTHTDSTGVGSSTDVYYIYYVTAIAENAFKDSINCESTNFTLPKTIETIGAGAFSGARSVDVTAMTTSALAKTGSGAFANTTVYVASAAQAIAIPEAAMGSGANKGRIVQKASNPFHATTADGTAQIVQTGDTLNSPQRGFTLQYKSVSGSDWTNTLAADTPYTVYLNTTPVPLLGDGVETYVHIDNTTCAVSAVTDVAAGAKVTVTVRNCGDSPLGAYTLSIAGTPVAGSIDSLFVGTPAPTTTHDVIVSSSGSEATKYYQLSFEGNNALYIGADLGNLAENIGKENSAKANNQVHAETGHYFIASTGSKRDSDGTTLQEASLSTGDEATLSITLNKTSGGGSDTGFSFDKDSLELEVGQSDKLTLTGDISKILSSKSLDENVATVKYEDSSYTVTAKSVGTTTIQIINMSDKNKVVASCTVTVVPKGGSGDGGTEPGGETGALLADAKAKAEAALDAFTATNSTTQQDVLNVVKNAINNNDITVTWQVGSPQMIQAGADHNGIIKGTLVLEINGQTVTVEVNEIIAAIPAVDPDAAITVTVTTTDSSVGSKTASGTSMSNAMENSLKGVDIGSFPATLNSIKTITVTGGYITKADWNALSGLQNLTTVNVESSVTSVADMPDAENGSLFQTSLVSISVPQAIKVGSHAFQGCNKLKTVSIPNATSIGDYAFDSCTALTEANFPHVTSIGLQGFRWCNTIQNISFPNVAEISNQAFEHCIALTSVSLPQATSIGANAFKDCSKLASLSLPATPPTTVGTDAFKDCPDGRTLTIVGANGAALTGDALAEAQGKYLAAEDGNKNDNLWYGWKVADAVTPPPAVTGTIVIKVTDGSTTTTVGGDNMEAAITASNITATSVTKLEVVSGKFTDADWKYLKSLTAMTDFTIDEAVTDVAAMPDGAYNTPVFPKSIVTASVPQVTSIGKHAFRSCKALTSASFPKATSIGNYAFGFCNALKTVSIPAATSIGESAFEDCKVLKTADFPNVTTIGDNAFSQCKALTEINFEKATAIGEDAFSYCDKLATVKLPLITAVPSSALYACTALTSVTLPMAESIGANVFYECASLTAISLPKATSIGNNSFEYCSMLASISLPASPPTAVGRDAFSACAASRTLTIVDESGAALTDTALATAVAAYKADTTGYNAEKNTWFGWTLPASADPPPATGVIVIKATNGNGTTTVGGDTLAGAITASGITKTEITKLEIVSGKFTATDWGQLKSLSKMTGFTINSGVTVDNMPDDTSGTSIFPTSIVTVSVPQATPIGENAFINCTKLTSVDFPEATRAGTYAFAVCTSLTSIELPKATEIQNSAFKSCTALTSVTLPLAATIGDNAFSGCILLAEVELPLATSLGEYAFKSCKALAAIELPKVETVGWLAFGDCAALAEINLPSVTAIGTSAFNGCTKLAKITLPATPPTIDNNSNDPFYGCPTDRTAFVPAASVDTYKAVADGKPSDGLWYGWKVTDGSVTPPPVTGAITIKVNGSATAGGANLQAAITASSVSLANLTSLEVTSGKFTADDWKYLKQLTAMTGFTIDAAVTDVADMPDGFDMYAAIFPLSIVSVSVPQATPIGNYAFFQHTSLTNADFPNATSVGTDAFYGCQELTNITLTNVTSLETYAFYNCKKLANITLTNVTSIGEFAFALCEALTNANFPAAESIERSAFNGCTKLATITLPAAPPTVSNSNAFNNCPAERTVIVPASAVAAYKAADDGNKTDNFWYGWTISGTGQEPPTPDTHTVTGTVKDQAGNPVNNATVTLTPVSPTGGSTSQTQTDSDGKYTFDGVPEGSYEIQVTFPDGSTATGTITVKPDGTITGGTDITKPADPVPGGGLSSPLTQDMVDDVFGPGNATWNQDTGTITINNDITLTLPVDVNTSVTIDLNGHNITGANGADNSDSPASDGQPAFRVTADDVTLTFTNSGSGGGVVKGGDGGNGDAQYPNGGAGAPAVSQDTHTNCKIEVGTNTELQGGKGGDAYSGGSGNGGNGGDGSSTGTGDTTIQPGGSTTGGDGGNGSGDGSGGNGGNGSSTDSGNITVDNGGTSTGGDGGEGSGNGNGGNGGNGSDTATGDTTVNGGATGGNGGDASDPSGSGNGGNGGNGSSANPGETVNGSGTVTGGNGGDAAGSGEGGDGGKGLPDGVNPGAGLDVADGVKGHATVVIDDEKAGTTVTVLNEDALIDAVLTEDEKKDSTAKVILSVEKQDSPASADQTAIETELKGISANTIGIYFDISLQKVIGSTPTDINETTSEIEIRITIPAGMRGGSNYQIIRVHGGSAEALETRQEGNDLIFRSDKFSTYAIAYTPKSGTPTPGPSHNWGGSSNTYYHYTITAAAGEGGSISPSGEVYVRELDDQVFTVKAADGYQVDKLLIDGREAALKDGTYTFKEVLADHTIRASFVKMVPETGTQAKPNQTHNPATGDNLNLAWLFVCLSVLAGSNLFAAALLRRNRRARAAASVK